MTEEQKPKKKRVKTPTRNAGLAPGPMYPPGTPLNPHTGLPYSDVPIDPRVAESIGYDADSARLNQVVSHVQKRKAHGDTNIRFDAPDPVKYEMCVRENPAGFVRFQMIEPVTDDNIPTKSAVAIDTWPKLVDHLQKSHWKGGRAVYKWWVGDSTNYQKATGKVHFAEREEVDEVSNQPPNNGYPPGYGAPGPYGPMMPNPMQGPPPQQQGWPQQQWPGYGMPQMAPQQMPMPQMMPMPIPYPMPMMQQPPQQAQPQQPAPQPQQPQMPQMPQYPMAPGMMDPNVVAMLMQLTRENASLIEEVKRAAQQPQQAQPQIPPHLLPFLPYMMSMYQNPYMSMMYPGYGQPQQQAPAPKPPEEKPEEKLTPIQLMTHSLDMASQMASLGRKYAEKFAPPEKDEPPPPPPKDEESLPHVIKDLPHMRAVFDRATGAPVDGVTMMMYNGDKIADAAKGMLKEARGLVKEWSEERDKMIAKRREATAEQARSEEEALQRAERLQRVATGMGQTLPPAPNQVIVNAQGNPVVPSQGAPPNGGASPAQ